MKPIHVCFAIVFAIAGCSGHSTNNLSSDSEIAESFKKFDDFAALVARSNSTKVYEGLPHNYWEPEQYESERKSKPTITIQDFDFYETPISTTPASLKQFQDLLTAKSSFEPFHGGKACGGFHPDWCATWTDGHDSYTIFLCFGCGEMKAFKNGKRIILCDMADKSQFESLLNPLHVNRPKRQLRKEKD